MNDASFPASQPRWNWVGVPRRAGWLPCVGLAFALAIGLLIATNMAGPAAAFVAVVGLVLAGAALPIAITRITLLAALLLVPDLPLGQSWGLLVHWSNGLTLTNLALPALALPLFAGAWLAGQRLMPRNIPGFAVWMWLLLAWGGLTLLAPLGAGLITVRAGITLLAHLGKLAAFVWLGVTLAGAPWWDGRTGGRVLGAGVVVNAVIGLGQAAGWFRVFSPLAQASAGQARATGMFYDANMFAIIMAGALLCGLAAATESHGRRVTAWYALALLCGAALAASGSRAGWLAFGAGLVFLMVRGRRRCLLPALVVCLMVLALFPARSWQRLRAAGAAVATMATGGAPPSHSSADPTTFERMGTMAQAWIQFQTHPLLGLGFGRDMYLGVPALSPFSPVTPVRAPVYQGAQNSYLTVLADAGPVGLALLLLGACDPLRRGWRRPQTWPLLAGYAGLLAASLTLEALFNARLLALVAFLVACP